MNDMLSDDLPVVSLRSQEARVFWPLYGDGPFEQCVACQKPLLETRDFYLIERAFKGTEPIFEYALCFACREKCGESISEESLQRLNAYFEEHVDLEARMAELLAGPRQLDRWLAHCLLTRQPREDCREFQVFGLACQDELILSAMPMLISGQGMERLQRLLSRKTRDALGDFTEQYLGMPPEFRLNPSDLLLV